MLEKFHAILERMGILLEFGDGDTASGVSAHSPTASDQPTTSSVEVNRRRQLGQAGALRDEESALSFTSPHSPGGQQSGINHEPEVRTTLQYARRSALSSIFNRWHDAATRGRQNGIKPLGFGVDTNSSSQRPPAPIVSSEIARSGQNVMTPQTAIKSTHPPHQDVLRGQPLGRTSPVPSRPSVLPLLDSWQRAAAQQQASTQDRDVALPQTPEAVGAKGMKATLPKDDKKHEVMRQNLVGEGSGRLSSPRHEKTQTLPLSKTQSPRPTPPRAVIEPESSILAHQPDQIDVPRTPQRKEDKRAHDALETERLMYLASRAREIFIASKVFNHWADKTARRLEREAVARRHMIRFRCFRSWCQGPNSQVPAANRLRVTTAAQKLRRAVAENEEQLRLAAVAASQSRHVRTVQKVLDMWARHKTENEARLRIARRSRLITLGLWLGKAHEHTRIKELATEQHEKHAENRAIGDWYRQAVTGAARSDAAKRIGTHRVSHGYLVEWWDQAELSRRAQEYHRRSLAERAGHCFDMWNLQARKQAFIWRNDYVTVTRIFDTWMRKAQQDARNLERAKQLSALQLKVNYADLLLSVSAYQEELGRLHRRARLYISATRVVTVFEHSAKQRQAQRWDAIKRHLHTRYEQVSAARKQKAFFRALDGWRDAAILGQRQNEQVERFRRVRDASHRGTALALWVDESANGEMRQYEASLYHALPRLDAWSAWSHDQEQQYSQARDMVAVGKQIQYQRIWSTSSLQHGGLAHTANMVVQRYQREKRTKALQQWRFHGDKGKSIAPPPSTRRRVMFGAPEGPRSTRRPFQKSLPLTGRENHGLLRDTIETPTRWTGQPLPMGSLFSNRPMPPVSEADEEHTPTSSQLEDDDVPETTPPRRQARGARINTGLATTTPRAPVPDHVEQEFRLRFARSTTTSRPGATGSRTPFLAPQASREARSLSDEGRQLARSTSAPLTATTGSRPPFTRYKISRPSSTGPSMLRQPVSTQSMGTGEGANVQSAPGRGSLNKTLLRTGQYRNPKLSQSYN